MSTFYKDHWVDIEPERMARYEAMFQWRDGQGALVEPARIEVGQRVVDYGCGPGGLAIELARRVGAEGKVFAVDINPDFLSIVERRAEEAGVAERIELVAADGLTIPLPNDVADRVVCKNVLEYVPDPEGIVAEFYRVATPGGIVHVSDSDWGAFIVSPEEDHAELMAAAGVAFKTPHIGRRLHGMFADAGFAPIETRMLATPDTVGGMRSVIENMTTYASTAGFDEGRLQAFRDRIDAAIEAKRFFAVLPQFLVTGHVPNG